MSVAILALIIYFIFLIAFVIFSIFAIYHLWQYCYVGDLCRPVAIAYGVTASAIVIITLIIVLINLLSS